MHVMPGFVDPKKKINTSSVLSVTLRHKNNRKKYDDRAEELLKHYIEFSKRENNRPL